MKKETKKTPSNLFNNWVMPYVKKELEKNFGKWAEKQKLYEKLDEVILFGKTLKINKKTGKISVI